MNLYEISKELLEFEQLMTDLEGEIPSEEIERQITEWFENISDQRDEKIDNYAALIRTMDARAKMRKEEAKRLTLLAQTDENAVSRLKERLKYFFQTHELGTLQTRRFKVSLANNGGVRPLILSVEAYEVPECLPDEFKKSTVTANTTAIREALEAGAELDFAQLGERGQSIRIK